jgi:hypothetical protein
MQRQNPPAPHAHKEAPSSQAVIAWPAWHTRAHASQATAPAGRQVAHRKRGCTSRRELARQNVQEFWGSPRRSRNAITGSMKFVNRKLR